MNKALRISVTDLINSESSVIGMAAPGQMPIYYTDWNFNQSFPDFIGGVISTKPPGVRFNIVVFEPAQEALARLQMVADMFSVFASLLMAFPVRSRQLGFNGSYSEQYQSTYDTLTKAVFDENNKEVRIVHHPSRRRHHIEHISSTGGAANLWHHLQHGGRDGRF